MQQHPHILRASILAILCCGLTAGGEVANQAPVANAAIVNPTQNIAKAIVLTGSDADGDALTFAVASQPLHGVLSGVAPNLVFMPAAGFTGGDSFTFTVSDGKTLSVPATVSLNVAPAGNTNQAPTTTLTAPAPRAYFAAGAPITMRATGRDVDGTITQMSFYADGVKIGASTTAPYEFVWTNPTPGMHVLTSKAFDDGAFKMFSFSAPVQVLVAGATTPPPITPPGTTPVPPPSTTVLNTKYGLNVVGGTGTGSYTPGTVVNLSAYAPAAGFAFGQWNGAPVVNATSPDTTFVMPAAYVTLNAGYVALPTPPLVAPAAPTNPILFVTQIPIAMDFTTIGAVFGNHRATPDSVGRGGDLYIRYTTGAVRNLTGAAGYGVASGFQGATSIAVRDPAVHWSGQKAIFSMVVGSPASASGANNSHWQLYEISGLGAAETPVVTLVKNQPANFNNISPCYGTDGRIIFTSDRPRNGQAHLYPQLDEYELAPTVTGLWSLEPSTGDLFNINHTPSGAFTPIIDSFGRLIFTRWDHLQRDQEADIDLADIQAGRAPTFGTFNFSDETAAAQILAGNRSEMFPEPRTNTANCNGLAFNHFMPWMIQEDGTEEETINHVGRHELVGYAVNSFFDSNLTYQSGNPGTRYNPGVITNLLQMKEDPTRPGRYLGVDAPEFSTHASGQLVALNGAPSINPDRMTVDYLTHPATKTGTPAPAPNHTGHFREPLPLTNGTLVAVHTDVTDFELQRGVGSVYAFRLKTLWQVGTFWQAYQPLTSGISKSVSYYSNGGFISYSGPLWELNPVEVCARPIPHGAKAPLGLPEQQVFAEEGVAVAVFQDYLRTQGLALVVSRDVTSRDHADHLQPFNLRIAGTSKQTLGAAGKIYDVAFMQFLQADQIRGYGMRNGSVTPVAGRRVLAEPLHDPVATAANAPAASAGFAGGVQLGDDGSMAAFLPARRATTWQLTDIAGMPTVRERYWLTFQPGEIRTCASCHGVNTVNQANQPAPTNKPEALRTLLRAWKAQTGN